MAPQTTHYCKPADNELLPYIRAITDKRSSYGYRRVTVLLNHRLQSEGKLKVNHKRVYRIMKHTTLEDNFLKLICEA